MKKKGAERTTQFHADREYLADCSGRMKEVKREAHCATQHGCILPYAPPSSPRWLLTAHKPLVIISSKSVVGSTGMFPARFRENRRTCRKGDGTTERIECAKKENNDIYTHRILQKWSVSRR